MISAEQRTDIDALLMLQRSATIAWADLKAATLNSLSSALGLSWHELTKDGPRRLRAIAKRAPDTSLILGALNALEHRDAQRLVLRAFDVRELKSGKLAFSFENSRRPRKFILAELQIMAATAEKTMRLARSRLSLWEDRHARQRIER